MSSDMNETIRASAKRKAWTVDAQTGEVLDASPDLPPAKPALPEGTFDGGPRGPALPAPTDMNRLMREALNRRDRGY